MTLRTFSDTSTQFVVGQRYLISEASYGSTVTVPYTKVELTKGNVCVERNLYFEDKDTDLQVNKGL